MNTTSLMIAAMTSALACLGGCSEGEIRDLRESECEYVASADYEACLSDARDPRYAIEDKRREQAASAKTAEDKRRKACEALRDPEMTECLAGSRSAGDSK